MKAKIRKKKYNDRELEKLWDEFEDVTMVEDEKKRLKLASKWLHFDAGTYDDEILEWFNKNYSRGVECLIEGNTPIVLMEEIMDYCQAALCKTDGGYIVIDQEDNSEVEGVCKTVSDIIEKLMPRLEEMWDELYIGLEDYEPERKVAGKKHPLTCEDWWAIYQKYKDSKNSDIQEFFEDYEREFAYVDFIMNRQDEVDLDALAECWTYSKREEHTCNESYTYDETPNGVMRVIMESFEIRIFKEKDEYFYSFVEKGKKPCKSVAEILKHFRDMFDEIYTDILSSFNPFILEDAPITIKGWWNLYQNHKDDSDEKAKEFFEMFRGAFLAIDLILHKADEVDIDEVAEK